MRKVVAKGRFELLSLLERKLETPMLVLSFLWLVLMIIEFTKGLSSFFNSLSNAIWAIFIIDFTIKFLLAPEKISYLKRNWVTAVALFLPALRLFRIARLARIIRTTRGLRGLRLAKVLTSVNRGIRALGKAFGRRGFGYVLLLSLLVTLAGAAGIFAFEKDQGIISDYGTAVWWTAMMLTTMGSDYFPKSSEGRLLALLLAIYGFAVFGYVTATVATYFVGEDSKEKKVVSADDVLFEILQKMTRVENKMNGLRKELSENGILTKKTTESR